MENRMNIRDEATNYMMDEIRNVVEQLKQMNITQKNKIEIGLKAIMQR
jgi:hypothetical protein